MDEFLIHSCEQVLRFSRVEKWDDLSEERKVQLGFNMGVVAHGLKLTKEEGFQSLQNVRQGLITMSQFHEHLAMLVSSRNVLLDEEKIVRPF